MAKKRMFNLSIVDSDAFLDMPLSTQGLYFHLNMRADDDGFIGNPKRIQRLVGASDDDLKLLFAKRFILTFEDGVIVIKHWRMHNTIRLDRYTPTVYQEELKKLGLKQNKSYTVDVNQMATKRLPNGNPDIDIDIDLDTDKGLDLGKGIDSTRTNKATKHKHGEYSNVLLTDDEFNKLNNDYPNAEELITFLDEYIEMKGYKAKSHYLAIKKWVADAVNERKTKTKNYQTVENNVKTSNPFLEMLGEETNE